MVCFFIRYVHKRDACASGGFFTTNDTIEEVNLSLLEKVKLIDKLAPDEQQALLKMIDLAISNKRMKDNLSSLIND